MATMLKQLCSFDCELPDIMAGTPDALKVVVSADVEIDTYSTYSGNHHTCSYNFFVLLFCSLEYISITMSSNGNLTTQV